jgi:hypothetical protein
MEGTLGAVECALFRESVQEAALRSRSRFGGICLAVPFERGRYRTAAGVGPLSGTGRHGIATEGVRVSQVGVNPSRRAVVVGGGREGGSQSDPWPEATRLAVPRKRRHHLLRGGLPSQREVGFRQLLGVLGGHTAVEVDRRHVAQALR